MPASIPIAPNDHCYWVIPAQFMAGRNPTRYSDELTRETLSQLLLAGVRVVIDLTMEHEIIPYQALLMEQAQFHGHSAEHHRFPIRDMDVCNVNYMKRILDCIDTSLSQAKPVYVHCYAGVGRTGLVVGCHFVRHGMSGEQALAEIARLRENVNMAWMRSPESDDQVEMVMAWQAGL